MNTLLSLVYFIAFSALLLLSEYFRFNHFIQNNPHPVFFLMLLLFSSFCLGVLIHSILYRLRLISASIPKKIIYGGGLGIVFFSSFFWFEQQRSFQFLNKQEDKIAFSDLKGHCGLFIGRGLLRFYRLDWETGLENHLREYRLNDLCRNKHFIAVEKKNALGCASEQDGIRCRLEWMDVFANKGFWNANVRLLFLDQVMKVWFKESTQNQEDAGLALFEYLLKDKQITEKSPDILNQMNIEEQFSDEYLYEKQKEERDELLVTQEIYSKIKEIIVSREQSSKTKDLFSSEPYSSLENAIKLEIERLPELDKNIEILGKKLKQN